MTEINSSPCLPSAANPPPLTKRQSKPSQFASSIRSFKQLNDRNGKRGKGDQPQPDETSVQNRQGGCGRSRPLKCLLPSGKKLNLSIMIKKNRTKKARKQVSFKVAAERDTDVCPNEPTTNSPPAFDLLTKFLQAAQELNKLEQEQKEKQKIELGQSLQPKDQTQTKREGRARAERDQNEKLQRFIVRSEILSSKLDRLLSDMSYL